MSHGKIILSYSGPCLAFSQCDVICKITQLKLETRKQTNYKPRWIVSYYTILTSIKLHVMIFGRALCECTGIWLINRITKLRRVSYKTVLCRKVFRYRVPKHHINMRLGLNYIKIYLSTSLCNAVTLWIRHEFGDKVISVSRPMAMKTVAEFILIKKMGVHPIKSSAFMFRRSLNDYSG